MELEMVTQVKELTVYTLRKGNEGRRGSNSSQIAFNFGGFCPRQVTWEDFRFFPNEGMADKHAIRRYLTSSNLFQRGFRKFG